MQKRWLMGLIIFLLVGCQMKEPPVEKEDPEEEIIEEIPQEEVKEEVLRSFLDGSKVDDQDVSAVMVMIENTDAARPHSGISVADIVYEVAMEKYSTTRFLAIFSSVLPEKVGPVRSARIPFVLLAKQWMLPYAHYGAAKSGDGDAYSLIKNIRWPIRFDGVSGLNDDWYFRDNKRSSPHNAYFNAQAASVKIPSITLKRGFSFSDEVFNGTDVTSLTIDIVATVSVGYVYDPGVNKYQRFINGKPMMDASNGTQVAVSNIIVLQAPHQTVTPTQYVLVDFNAGGPLSVFSGGKMITGTWKMVDSMIQYLDDQGHPIVLTVGNTWIQIVSPSMRVAYE
jgi:hypothetical protein